MNANSILAMNMPVKILSTWFHTEKLGVPFRNRLSVIIAFTVVQSLILFIVFPTQINAAPRSDQYFYPGEPVTPDSFRITILGTGTPFPRRDQAGASVLVETTQGKLLFDIGPGAPANLTSLEIPMAELDTVYLSHLHVDHVGGLDSLWIGGWVYGRSHPLTVWGPPGTSDFCNHLIQTYDWDIRTRLAAGLPPSGSKLICKEYEADQNYATENTIVRPFEVVHLEAGTSFGFRIQHKNRTVVYSGDTTYSENLVKNSQEVDVLIHEAFPPAEIFAQKTGRSLELTKRIAEEIHISPRQLGRVFSETKPGLGVIYHLYNDEDIKLATLDELRTTYRGRVSIAYDLMVIDVGEEIHVRSAVVGGKPWPVRIKTEDY